MNKVYKVVWNIALGTWVAVSELAKGHSKTKSKKLRLLALPLAMGSILCSAEILAAQYEVGGGNAAVSNSIAIGTDASTASSVSGANQSIAIGYSTKASGDQTVALGANVVASGNSAVAIGGDDIDRLANDKTINDAYEALTGVRLIAGTAAGGSYRATTASGAGAVALGTQTQASGNFATAVGMTATASGNASSAFGVYAEASGGAALAIGAISKAQAEQSIALGTNSQVVQAATNSIAIGNGAVATNKDSIALGSGSAANSTTLSNQAYLVGGTATGELNIGDRRITGVSAGSDDTDAVNVSQLKQVMQAATEAKTTVSQGKNMVVTETTNVDGSTDYEVATADDLDVTSLTAGDTTLDTNGLTIGGGPSVTVSGINAGDLKVTNVAAGDISLSSKDAVNGSQLYQTNQDVINAQNSADAAQATADKGISFGDGATSNNYKLGDTINVTGDSNVTSTTTSDGVQLALAKDIAVDSITAGGTILNQSGLSFVNSAGKATGPSISSTGINAGNTVISNVAAGLVDSTSTDAVNGSQLSALQDQVTSAINSALAADPKFKITSDGQTAATVVADSTIDIGVAAGETNLTTSFVGQTIDFSLNKDLTLDSVTTGATKISDDGLQFLGAAGDLTGPSVTVAGIDAGSNKITSVAAGTVSSASTDAVNGSQLYSAQSNVAAIIGGGTVIDANGNIVTDDIGGTGKNTIDEAVAAAKTTVSQGKNMVVTETTNADGSSDYEVATADDLDVTSLTAGDTLINSNGLTIANGPSITVSGINAGNKVITNVAAGSISSTSTDAVNGSQLYALDSRLDSIINKNIAALEQGFNLSANGDDASAVVAGETIDIGTASLEQNLTVTKSGNTIDFALNPDLFIDSVTAGNNVFDTNGLSISDNSRAATVVSAGSIIVSSGSSQLTLNAATGDLTGLSNTDLGSSTFAQDGRAATEEQLNAAQDNLISILGGNAVNNGGEVSMSDIGGTGETTIDDAIKAVNEIANKANQGWNVSINGGDSSNVKPGDTVDFSNTDGNVSISNSGSSITVNLNKDQNLGTDGSLTVGDTTVDNNGLTIAGGPSVTGSGVDAGDKQITNVADGEIAAGSQDAVNGGQIYDMMGAGAYDANGNLSNIGGTGESNINDAIAAVNKAAAESKNTVEAGSNIQVSSAQNADGSTNYVVSTADDITLNSVTAKDVTADTVTANQIVAGNTTIDSSGLSIKDGPSITASGVDAGNQAVSNVSNGIQNSDAVNMGQLAQYLGGGAGYNNITESFDAPTYNVNGGSYNNVGDALGALNQADQVLGDRITNLGDQLQQAFYTTNARIDDVEKKANAGIAAAMALETAPYIPGKYTYAAGAAYHGGENAVGVTLRKTADNGRWSLTGGIAAASEGDPSVRIGISGVID